MRCQIFRAPLGALPVIAPFRGCASHQFTGGLDFIANRLEYKLFLDEFADVSYAENNRFYLFFVE